MSNTGTRPASQVLIQFEAQGPIELCRIEKDDDGRDDEGASSEAPSRPPRPHFPASPAPPAFKKVIVPSSAETAPSKSTAVDLASLGFSGSAIDEARRISERFSNSFDPLSGALRNLHDLGGVSRIMDQYRGLFGTPGMEELMRGAVPREDIGPWKPLSVRSRTMELPSLNRWSIFGT